jgi:hypothetical protein
MPLTDPQKATLKNELTNDPEVLGYAALLAIGNDQGLADLINAIGVGGDFQVPREPVTPSTIIDAITVDDFLAMQPTDFQRLQFVLSSQQTTNLANESTREKVLATLPADGPSRTAVNNLQTRQGTRGEVVLGVNGIRLTANDIAAARNYSP